MKFPYWSYFQPEPRPAATVSWVHITTLWLQKCLVALISSFQNRNYVWKKEWNPRHSAIFSYEPVDLTTLPWWLNFQLPYILWYYQIWQSLIYGQQNFISTIFAKSIPWRVSIAVYEQFLHLSFEPMAPQNTKANHVCNYY